MHRLTAINNRASAFLCRYKEINFLLALESSRVRNEQKKWKNKLDLQELKLSYRGHLIEASEALEISSDINVSR